VPGYEDSEIGVFDALTGRQIGPTIAFAGGARLAALSNDGSRLIVLNGYDKSVVVWNTDTGRPAYPPLEHGSEIKHAAFSSNGNHLLTASDASVRVWRVTDGSLIRAIDYKDDTAFNPLWSVSFNECGDRIAIVLQNKDIVQVWNINTGERVAKPINPTEGARCAWISPDDSSVATADAGPGGDGVSRVWNLSTGQPVTPAYRTFALLAIFSKRGPYFLTGSEQGRVRVWDLTSGLALTPPLNHGGPVFQALFDSAGRFVYTSTVDNERSPSTHAWDITPDSRPIADLHAFAKLLSGHLIDEAGELVPIKGEKIHRYFTEMRAKYPDGFQLRPVDR